MQSVEDTEKGTCTTQNGKDYDRGDDESYIGEGEELETEEFIGKKKKRAN